eukprot:867101_1
MFPQAFSLASICGCIYFITMNHLNAFSACDPVDVYFVIDTHSIYHYSDAIIELINEVILRGSSEETGFSVIVYGQNVPYSADSTADSTASADSFMLLSANTNAQVKNRQTLAATTKALLATEFMKIHSARWDETKGDIGIETAMTKATDEASSRDKTARLHQNRDLHGSDVGLNEDEDVFFVFDYWNTLTSAKDGYFENLITRFQPELDSIHFVFGTENLNVDSADPVEEEEVTDPSVNAITSHFFKLRTLVQNINNMNVHSPFDRFLDLTCPAAVKMGTDNEVIGLGNHNHYVENGAFLNCDYVFDDVTEKLDVAQSWIEVTDSLKDESTVTFQPGDFLFINEKVMNTGDFPEGCKALSIVQIINIFHTEPDIASDANTLWIKVREPKD